LAENPPHFNENKKLKSMSYQNLFNASQTQKLPFDGFRFSRLHSSCGTNEIWNCIREHLDFNKLTVLWCTL